ncbi:uncharacterized protein CDAR_95611 [Caerostris darwini]|uniref:Uncharacterized protein n=1 Tax=Caerostris darwini TaxID=1538125 RepID=A0AAV4UQN7_9ARAC|nr:uncharacterized protein CDAR_95611 [Caerostris darwini]
MSAELTRLMSLGCEISARKKKPKKVRICFTGDRFTGRSTLATRFSEMQAGFYDRDYRIVRKNRHQMQIDVTRRYGVPKTGEIILTIHIEPPPSQETQERYPFWMISSIIKLIVFCFDVNRPRTFINVPARLSQYRELLGNKMPPTIMVGNKIDIRSKKSLHVVTKHEGKRSAKELKIKRYVECSAWKKTNVDDLLDLILTMAKF